MVNVNNSGIIFFITISHPGSTEYTNRDGVNIQNPQIKDLTGYQTSVVYR